MSIGDIFQMLHGTLNPDTDFVPVGSKAKAIAKYLNINVDFIVNDKKDMFHPFAYFDGLYYCPLLCLDPKVYKKIYSGNYVEQFQKSKEYFHSLKAENKWKTLFDCVDKKLLFYVFVKEYKNIPDNMKWDAYKEAHIRAESGFDYIPKEIMDDLLIEKSLLSLQRKKRLAELKKAVKGKEKFIVYHGNNSLYDPKDEMSWTLQRETAVFFATRFNNPNPKIFKKEIDYSDVLDYFSDRSEAEIILKIK